jgi:hypothetical protein
VATPGRTVQERTYATALTVPAATPEATPALTTISVGDVVLQSVRVVIPTGHQFLTGVAVVYSRSAVVPFNDPLAFLVGDGTDRTYPVNIQVTQPVQILGFNLDIYPHTFHLELAVVDWQWAVVTPRGVLPASAIEAAP